MSAPPTLARLTALNVLVAVLYAALGTLALTISQVGIVAPFWPAAGVAFAFAFRWRWMVLPGIAVGSIAGNAIALTLAGVEPSILSLTSIAVGIGAAVQALVGGEAVRRYVGARSSLADARDILLFLLLAGPVATLINATVGTLTQLMTGILSGNQAATAWLTWWVGDALGVIVIGPIALMLIPDSRQRWAGRRWKVAVPSLFVAGLLVAAVVVTDSIDAGRVATEREYFGRDATETLTDRIQLELEVLEGIKGLQLSSGTVTADEFRTFANAALSRHPSFGAVAWNALVPADELDDFLLEQRLQPGRADFSVTERNDDGELVPAGQRDPHMIVQYIEPLEQNAAALGFDIGSDSVRRVAAETARDTGKPTATPPIDLLQGSGTGKGVLVLDPVYDSADTPADVAERRARLQGFAVGVYKVSELLAESFAAERWNDASLRLVDVTAGSEPTVLAERPAVSEPTIDLARGEPTPIDVAPVELFGRTWALEVVPVAGNLTEGQSGASPVVLLVALLGMYFFEALLLLLTGLEQQARREARERSYEANHDPLTGLVNRRGFIAQLDALTSAAAEEQRMNVLLFADLDAFKDVNDAAGHDAGDAMLRAVADRLRRCVRTGDTVARIGGDEFAIILANCPVEVGLRTARAVIEEIDSIRLGTHVGELTVGVSIGLTAFGWQANEDPDRVLRQADSAAYLAKGEEGSQVRLSEDAQERSNGSSAQ